MTLLLVAPLATVGAYILTQLIIARAPQLRLVQVPNSRSSHVRPTPSGGGLAISIVSLCLGLGLSSINGLSPTGWVFFALAGSMAALGAVDDVKDLSPILRLFVQFSVISVSITVLIHWVFDFSIENTAIFVLFLFLAVWWVNLFNFMDGIDGIAALQSIVLFSFLLVISVVQKAFSFTDHYSVVLILTLASLIGFIPNNWHPAKLFMGDSGSMFISFVLLMQILHLVAGGALSYGAAVSLVSVFAADATVTLVRRSLTGHRPWSAHRQHAYQKLARRFGHEKVTLCYAALTLFWAAPLAGLATFFRSNELWLSIACYAPLLAAAILVGGGREDTK